MGIKEKWDREEEGKTQLVDKALKWMERMIDEDEENRRQRAETQKRLDETVVQTRKIMLPSRLEIFRMRAPAWFGIARDAAIIVLVVALLVKIV